MLQKNISTFFVKTAVSFGIFKKSGERVLKGEINARPHGRERG